MKKILCTACLVLVLIYNALAAETNLAPVASDNIDIETLAKTSSSWNNQPLPCYPEGVPEITILRIHIPPGAELSLHKHPVINAGVLLAGELTVITEDNDLLCLKSGDAIVEVVDKWHYGRNMGEETAEIIVFYAGIQDSPVTIE
jgi:quercetin dioxygenase-like cupin family protein